MPSVTITVGDNSPGGANSEETNSLRDAILSRSGGEPVSDHKKLILMLLHKLGEIEKGINSPNRTHHIGGGGNE